MPCAFCERVRGQLPDALASRLRELERRRDSERALKRPIGASKRPEPATSGVVEMKPAGRAQPVSSRGGRP